MWLEWPIGRDMTGSDQLESSVVESCAARLSVSLLGPPEVRRDGRPVRLPTRKTLALLAYLVAEPEARARASLAALFWPESDAERAHAALRRTLARLREAIGGEFLEAWRDLLRFVPIAAAIDLNQARLAWEIARGSGPLTADEASALRRAVDRDRGPFLEGLSLSDAPDYDDWASVQREAWHRRLGLVLSRLAEWQAETGDLAAALDTARRGAARDRYDEAAQTRLIQLYLAAGDRPAALAAYAGFRQVLADELHLPPSPDLVVLGQQIQWVAILGSRGWSSARSARTIPGASSAPPSPIGRRSSSIIWPRGFSSGREASRCSWSRRCATSEKVARSPSCRRGPAR